MTLTTTAVRDIPPIRHDEAMDLAAAEYHRFGALLHDLAPGDWTTATVCDRWDVRAVAAHVLGAAEACASIRENAHQMRRGHQVQRQLGLGHIVHGANEVQIRPCQPATADCCTASTTGMPSASSRSWRAVPTGSARTPTRCCAAGRWT